MFASEPPAVSVPFLAVTEIFKFLENMIPTLFDKIAVTAQRGCCCVARKLQLWRASVMFLKKERSIFM